MKRQLVGECFGNYTLVRLLGRGGFAEVYLGQHVRLEMQVAVKVLHTYLTEEETAGFQREAQVIARLVHPNIVRILDFDVKEGIPFLVMDYAPNGTLRQRHPGGTPLPLPTVVSYITQVADALQYAHDQKLIHRDVKPENMLIGRRGEIVLSDFGIATIAHSTSSMSTQASVGTIPYMAPEQIQAHPRPASDQYALGIVTYEWLTGERPFTGSYTEIFAKHLMTPPPPLRQKVPTLSAEVEQVVLTALAKEPKQRFGSVQAFATALQEANRATQQPGGAAVEETVFSHLPSSLPSTVLAPPAIHTPTDLTTPLVTVAPPPLPLEAEKEAKPAKSRTSQRFALLGVAGLLIVALVSGIVLFVPHFTNSNTSSTPTSSVPTIPHLKSLYSGTRDFHPENVEYPMVLHINSQDQQGNLMTSGNSGPDVNKSEVSCTGTVTVRGSITLQCRDNDGTSFVFHGNIYSDGHIEGTETFSDGSTNTDTLR